MFTLAIAACQPVAPPAAMPQPTGGADAAAPTEAFRTAEAAYMRHDFPSAETHYREVLAADPSVERQTSAAIALANIAWRVRQDTAAARSFLHRADSIDAREPAVSLEHARMRLVFGDFSGAHAAAREALVLAGDSPEESRAVSMLAETLIEPILQRLDPASAPLIVLEAERAALREVLPLLTRVVRDSPGALEPARLLLLAGALAGSGSALLAGWDSYYLIGTDRPAGNLLAEPWARLDALLRAREDLSAQPRERISLAQVLAEARFFEAAALVALLPDDEGRVPARTDRRAAEIVAYVRFLRQVSAFADGFYRRTAVGEGADVEAFRSGILAAAEALWPHLVWNEAPVPLSWEGLGEVLARKFGAVYTLGLTAGYPSLHMGHTVVVEERVVRQYGREAVVRFVSLDAIISNGYQSWAWDGRASTGGWGTATQMVQIRPSYAAGPLAAWRATTDAAARARAAVRIAADSVADFVRAWSDPAAFFPSIPARLLRDDRDRLLDSLQSDGLTGAELEAAFKREYANTVLESSIFAHEGRHAIDQTYEPDLTSEELEFRGKLSQVVFAPRPRLGAASGIFQANIGDGTPHGQANARIMQGLLEWMRTHAAQIPGLDPAEPLLPQLPLLTDQQLHAAFRSMEPLAAR